MTKLEKFFDDSDTATKILLISCLWAAVNYLALAGMVAGYWLFRR